MNINLNVTVRFEDDVLLSLVKALKNMSISMEKATAAISRNTSVTESARLLIVDFISRLKEAGTDPVALDALTSQLEANSDSLAKAVSDSTPAAEQPPVV